jgi:vacuolar-type H+-ATPase subunit H
LWRRGGVRGAPDGLSWVTRWQVRVEGGAVVSEALERIKEAENASTETLRRARADGKRLVAEAFEASERILEEMKKEVRGEENSLRETARSEAEAEALKIERESESAVGEIRTRAEGKLEAGVTKVLEAITAAA